MSEALEIRFQSSSGIFTETAGVSASCRHGLWDTKCVECAGTSITQKKRFEHNKTFSDTISPSQSLLRKHQLFRPISVGVNHSIGMRLIDSSLETCERNRWKCKKMGMRRMQTRDRPHTQQQISLEKSTARSPSGKKKKKLLWRLSKKQRNSEWIEFHCHIFFCFTFVCRRLSSMWGFGKLGR